MSLPVRGRGLKLSTRIEHDVLVFRVAPRAGAWIETPDPRDPARRKNARRSPCGGVD